MTFTIQILENKSLPDYSLHTHTHTVVYYKYLIEILHQFSFFQTIQLLFKISPPTHPCPSYSIQLTRSSWYCSDRRKRPKESFSMRAQILFWASSMVEGESSTKFLRVTSLVKWSILTCQRDLRQKTKILSEASKTRINKRS